MQTDVDSGVIKHTEKSLCLEQSRYTLNVCQMKNYNEYLTIEENNIFYNH